MAGSKTNTTTTTAASEPWSAAQPALNTALSSATSLYNAGTGAQPYTGQTYVNRDAQTQSGLDALSGYAADNSGGQGLSGQAQGIINNGGFTADQNAALANTRNVANSSFDLGSDPGFQQVLDQTRNSVNASISGAGRYGSGAHVNTLANAVGDVTANQYNNWLGRKDAANASLFNMGQQGQGNLSNAFSLLQQPANLQMQVGAANEDYATQALNDKLRIWNEQQNKPWENVARLNAIASGAGSLGGTNVQSQSTPGTNPFLTALGYGASGLGLLGGF